AARQVTLDSDCLQKLPQSDRPGAPKSLAEWQQLLPGADIQLDNLTIAPWQEYAGRFDLSLAPAKQTLRYRGDNLNIDASLQGQQLSVEQLTLHHNALPQPVTLHGRFELPEFANGLPVGGQLEGELQYAGEPLRLTLDWQQQQGELELYATGDGQPLLTLPWQADARQIRIVKGRYRWPMSEQTLSGFLDLTFDNWRQGLEETQITGRLNVLTQGRGGKGNAVLSIGPGTLSMTNSALPLRLTGESKLAAMQLYAALPGDLSGPLLDPQLRFQPGALLRLRGRILSTLEVDEARWPLAGVRLASQGIDGRLQAILKAHDPSFGQFRLHLDGRASDFWPDKGEWKWRYWGTGEMRPLNAAWTIQGAGGWRDTLIHLDSLNARFDRMQYGMAQVLRPRLTLSAPVNWQRDAQRPAFNGGFRIDAGETLFDFGGRLPASSLSFEAKGRDPSHFIWRGALQAQAIGPLRVHGRWDGERLRGEAWWPTQSLTVFQPLLNPELKMKIRAGELRAQVAFSAAAKEGFSAGGHWAVTQGSLWTSDNQINDVDFSLPFRLKDQQWQLGVRGPVQLRIGEITNQFAMKDIRADLQGYYPWSEAQPLTLQAVSMALLGGEVTLPALRLPQHQAATLSLRDISLSK
ncbi:YdbH family protein, partial [Pantoea septica]|uniref:YdbH family protein n=1 Tax=Pantoea septica TaxID=472695 RepID=UPI0035E3CCD2